MKKSLMLAIGLLGAVGLGGAPVEQTPDWRSDLSGDVSVGFVSEHTTRGRKDADKALVSHVNLEYRMDDLTKCYIGIDAVVEAGKMNKRAMEVTNGGVKSTIHPDFRLNPITPRVGITYEATDMVTVDGGYMHHIYAGSEPAMYIAKRDTSEVFLGATANVIASPSVYAFYDFGCEEFAVEGAASHSFDLSRHVTQGLGIDLGAKIGVSSAKKLLGIKDGAKYRDVAFAKDSNKAYFYYGMNADLVYGFGDCASAKVGVGFAGNTAKKEALGNAYGRRQNHVWFSAAVDCAF
jgi:hypothetical protein